MKPIITEIPKIDLAIDSDDESNGRDTAPYSASSAGIDKLSGVWALDDIRMLRTMLTETDEASGEDEKISRRNTLKSFLDSKELEVHKALDGIHRP
jgi:hypothetical protein